MIEDLKTWLEQPVFDKQESELFGADFKDPDYDYSRKDCGPIFPDDDEPVCTGPRRVFVHSGFLETYRSLRNEILGNLKKLIDAYPLADISLIGHR